MFSKYYMYIYNDYWEGATITGETTQGIISGAPWMVLPHCSASKDGEALESLLFFGGVWQT